MTQQNRAMVIGAQGGIGKALVARLLQDETYHEVHAVSRKGQHGCSDSLSNPKLVCHSVDSTDEQAVSDFVHGQQQLGGFVLLVCCIGILHGGEQEKPLKPEKSLRDISAEQLKTYFEINTLAPANWIKHLPVLMQKTTPAHAVFFSARVGSIEDNYLGGWFGYRASKAALNMLVKTAQIELRRKLPKLSLVSYHPGTVDTDLSKPFQKGVESAKLFRPEFTVEQLLGFLPDLSPRETAYYIDWQGKSIPW